MYLYSVGLNEISNYLRCNKPNKYLMRLLGTAAAASSPDELKDARGFTEAYISNPHAVERESDETKPGERSQQSFSPSHLVFMNAKFTLSV